MKETTLFSFLQYKIIFYFHRYKIILSFFKNYCAIFTSFFLLFSMFNLFLFLILTSWCFFTGIRKSKAARDQSAVDAALKKLSIAAAMSDADGNKDKVCEREHSPPNLLRRVSANDFLCALICSYLLLFALIGTSLLFLFFFTDWLIDWLCTWIVRAG